jgi:DNA polymerase elongation subunit (family B)
MAAKQLCTHGLEVKAGQTVSYIILDANNKRPERRVVAKQLMKSRLHYDMKEYIKFLDDALYNILSPFISKKEYLFKKRNFEERKLLNWLKKAEVIGKREN